MERKYYLRGLGIGIVMTAIIMGIALSGNHKMTDEEIIDLFFQRSEDALKQTDRKYRNLCYKIAWNILQNHQDGEECVNDSYLSLWNQIPPQRPDSLKIYLCRIVRNLSLKKYRDGHAGKRWAEGTLSI